MSPLSSKFNGHATTNMQQLTDSTSIEGGKEDRFPIQQESSRALSDIEYLDKKAQAQSPVTDGL